MHDPQTSMLKTNFCFPDMFIPSFSFETIICNRLFSTTSTTNSGSSVECSTSPLLTHRSTGAVSCHPHPLHTPLSQCKHTPADMSHTTNIPTLLGSKCSINPRPAPLAPMGQTCNKLKLFSLHLEGWIKCFQCSMQGDEITCFLVPLVFSLQCIAELLLPY